MTFKDNDWLMIIAIPHKSHFLNQYEITQASWGYGLFPSKVGGLVKKPISECSGEKMLQKLLKHPNFPVELLKHALTIPCMVPYVASQFLTRKEGDRPEVIP